MNKEMINLNSQTALGEVDVTKRLNVLNCLSVWVPLAQLGVFLSWLEPTR